MYILHYLDNRYQCIIEILSYICMFENVYDEKTTKNKQRCFNLLNNKLYHNSIVRDPQKKVQYYSYRHINIIITSYK